MAGKALCRWKASCRCFCQNQKKSNRKSENKSRLGTHKDVNSMQCPLRYPWKKTAKLENFPLQYKYSHAVIFDLNRSLETQHKVCVQCHFIPGLIKVTPSPTLSTTPAASCPRIIGKGLTIWPVTTWSSVRQTPVATIWFTGKTRTFQHLTTSHHMQK